MYQAIQECINSEFKITIQLEPVLANIILTEFKRVIVSELINDGVIKYYKGVVMRAPLGSEVISMQEDVII